MFDLRTSSAPNAASAYRNDIAGRTHGETFGAHDGVWIAVASLIDHAAQMPEADADIAVERAVELARTIERPRGLFLFGALTEGERRNETVETLQRLTEEIEQAGAVNLSLFILDALLAAPFSLPALQIGRINAQRARITWKMGDHAAARAIYRRLHTLANESGEIELRVRALTGSAAIAQIEEDFVGLRRSSLVAARLAAKHRLQPLERIARIGLFVAAARTQKFDEALSHGWKVYEMANGNPIALAESLTNLGQLLYDLGAYAPSRAAFAAVLYEVQPDRVGLPALGGFALASAALGGDDDVRWAAQELAREADKVHRPYLVELAATECVTALLQIGDAESARSLRDVALSIFSAGSLHEHAARLMRVELPATPRARPEPFALTPRGSHVTRKVALLEPRTLPRHVSFVAAA